MIKEEIPMALRERELHLTLPLEDYSEWLDIITKGEPVIIFREWWLCTELKRDRYEFIAYLKGKGEPSHYLDLTQEYEE